MTTLASRPAARHRLLLPVLAGNMLIDALEVSVVLVALPAIGRDLGLSPFGAQWVMSGFALGFAALLLLGPYVTGRWGRRRCYLLALLVFAAASAAGGLAGGGPLLVLTRVVKGMCAALTAPTGLAIIGTTFREGAEQRAAVSVYSLFGAAGFTAGLLSSGVLTGWSWRWDLLFPAPAALLLLAVGLRAVPGDRDRPAPKAPAPAAPARAAPAPRVSAGFPPGGPFVRAAVCAATLNGSYLGLLLLVTYRLHGDGGWTSWRTALALLPACLPLAVSLPFAGRMVRRFGTERLIAAGALTAALGQAAYALRGAPGGYATGVLPTLLLVGAGFVLSFAALNLQALSRVPAERRRLAVPLYQTAVQLGAALTLPAVAALLTAPDGGAGYRRAALLVAAVEAAGLLTALTGTRHRAAGPQHR